MLSDNTFQSGFKQSFFSHHDKTEGICECTLDLFIHPAICLPHLQMKYILNIFKYLYSNSLCIMRSFDIQLGK